MAPEQITTNKVNGQADQFSLAVIAYQMLSGHRPFVADSDPGLIFKIVSAEPQPLHECDRSFPPGASEVLQKALAKDPNQRFATCAEFVRHLSDALDGRTTPLTPPGPGPRPPRPWAPDWAIALGAVALLIVIVLVVSGVFERRAQRPAEGADAAAPPAAGSGQYAGDLQVNSRDGLKYVWIPPGTFAMGCSPGDNECYGDEKPARQVALPKGFWLGQTDVTQAAYRRVTGSDPSCFKGDNLPVEQVTWDEARSYCQVIGGRLPTEAEWEYAARAGSPAARYGTLDDVAWYAANSGEKTHEVGQKRANAFGLYDMLGNVWQWTEAWYREGGPERALRGGSFVYNPRGVRVSTRIGGEPGSRGSPVGFRCVWE
jgi:formylglycine-generating enzyme required for sulfatase activity